MFGDTKFKVEVVAYDNRYKTANAPAAYDRLINQDGVKGLIITSSAATIALTQNVGDDEVAALSSSCTSEALSRDTCCLIRVCRAPEHFVTSLAAWLRGNVLGRQVVMVNPPMKQDGIWPMWPKKACQATSFTKRRLLPVPICASTRNMALEFHATLACPVESIRWVMLHAWAYLRARRKHRPRLKDIAS